MHKPGVTFFARHTALMIVLVAALAGCGGGSGGSSAATLKASSSTFTTQENTTGTGHFNATIPPGRTPAYTIITNGTLGTATVSNQMTGEFTYTPQQNVTGSDFFTFRVNDGFSDSELAVVSVTIVANQSPPVASDDITNTTEDTPLSINVLANDFSNISSLDPTTVTLVSLPAHGYASAGNNGLITYAPDLNYAGSDTFTYTVQDILGNTSNIASVTVSVIPVNDPPTAINDTFTMPSGSINNTLSVLADNGNGADSDVENDPLTITTVGIPDKGGTATINATKDALFYTPPPNFTGVESFSYTISDGNGGTGTASVSINVVYSDDFSNGMGNWSTVNDSGAVSSWVVTGGMLKQQNRVENRAGAFDQSYHRGTYAYFTAGMALSNYRFSVDAIFLSTGLADDVGVMFRYQNNNNYYRLSMNSRYGFTRLEKKVAGVFTPLAVNARGYSVGQLLNFTIDLNGPLIQVLVNGEPLFAVNDTSLASGSVALYTQDQADFDNLLIEGPTLLPSVVLAAPTSSTVETTSVLTAGAIATNVPAGGSVEFLLDGTTSIVDGTAPYDASFSSVIQGNHTVEAIVRDAGNVEQTRDTNTLVGAMGNYYVAIGDSITNGEGDNYATDNQATRIFGFQGYEANLNTLLENSQPKPILIQNEGIGGDESVDTAFTRINSILARHPGSDNALVMLGTNDALASIPSGDGCTGAACNGTFKGNMQSLIDTLNAAGKTVYIARIPPVFGNPPPFADPANAAVNINYVQPYNNVVTNQLTGRQVGPDFYAYFLGAGQNRYSLFSNVWHPNALGYTVMAALWHNILNAGAPVALPFVLDNLVPSTSAPYVKQNLLEVGDAYYVDTNYTLNAIPPALANGRWIMTANADVGNTSSNYVSFTVDRAVTVYVAYDAQAATLPNWMNTFSNTGLTLGTTDPFSPTLKLYSRVYSAGSITLGGNSAAGASGSNSNYVAIIVGT